MKEIKKTEKNRGYVILFTVLVSSIILAIAVGVSSVAFREVTFNISAKDSHYALFAADSAAECALHYLLMPTNSPFVDSITGAWVSPVTITCGEENGQPLNLRATNIGSPQTPDYIFNTNADTLNPAGVHLPKGCGIPRVFLTNFGGQPYIRVQGIGYNASCPTFFASGVTAKTVQRAIEYTFLIDTAEGGNNQNNGTPQNGSGIFNVSAFDPNSLNGVILSSQNNDSGVLGSSAGGTLWGAIGDFFGDLFGINTNSQDGNQYGSPSQAPSSNLPILPTDGTIGETQKYAPDANPGYAPATQLPQSETAAQKWFEENNGGTLPPDAIVPEAPLNTSRTGDTSATQARLSTGMKVNTAANDATLVWFDRFAGETGDNGQFINTARMKTDVSPQTQYQTSVEKLQALPDGDDRSAAIADLLLERYGAMTGDQTLIDSIDPKVLVEAARTVSFDSREQTPEDVKALFDAYGRATGDFAVSEKINTELFSKLIQEFQGVSATSRTLANKAEAPQATVIGKIASFFKDLLGINESISQVSLSSDTPISADGLYTARLILSKYGTETGDWAITTKLSPEVLAGILSQYTVDGVITEDMVLDTINQYAKITGDQSIIRDVDTATLATAANEARLEARLSDTSLLSETPVSVETVQKVVLNAPAFLVGGDASWVEPEIFTKLMNTVLPTGPITPEIAKAFIAKYEEATGKTGIMGSISAEEAATVLNEVRIQSQKDSMLNAIEEPTSLLQRARLFLFRLFGKDVQVKQVGTDALSTANQAPQEVLNLLR